MFLSILFIIFIRYLVEVEPMGDHTFDHSLGNPRWCYSLQQCNNWLRKGPCSDNTTRVLSPINLPGSLPQVVIPDERVYNFHKGFLHFPGFELDYRAHTVQVKPLGQPFRFTRTFNSNKNVTYRLFGMDFHWGHENDKGSEHTIGGKSFAMEIHLGFYDELLFSPEVNEPIRKHFYGEERDILSIGILVGVAEGADVSKKSDVLKPLVDKLQNLTNDRRKNFHEFFSLGDLFGDDLAFRYFGSFTSPNCRETEWWIMRNPIFVPLEHLDAFRNAKVDGYKVDGNNFRVPIVHPTVQPQLANQTGRKKHKMLIYDKPVIGYVNFEYK